VWLEKQSVGRHDDSYDAGSTSASVAGSKDQLALYAQPSIADNGNTDTLLSTQCNYVAAHILDPETGHQALPTLFFFLCFVLELLLSDFQYTKVLSFLSRSL